jgi:hypothetical protein
VLDESWGKAQIAKKDITVHVKKDATKFGEIPLNRTETIMKNVDL